MEIGLRSTRITTRDDVQISIPNSIITNTKVINESAPEPRFRVRIQIGVAYGTDVDQAEEVLLTAARNNSLCGFVPSGILPWILNCFAGLTSRMTKAGSSMS